VVAGQLAAFVVRIALRGARSKRLVLGAKNKKKFGRES
jgi:hypothetical protein